MEAVEQRAGGGNGSTVMARLRAAEPLLGPSERRVAQVVLARPDEVIEWSTSELAAASGTSPATVIRACQSLGFRGFQHLRLEVARAAPESEQQATDAVGRVFEGAIDALRLGGESIDVEAVEEAVAALAGARRIVLVGSGFSGPPLQDAALRFSTLGHPVEAPVDVLAQQFASRSLTDRDVCLAVSYSGANAHTIAACRAAADCGATVIAITSFARSPLARIASITLATGPVSRAHDVDPFLSRLNHLVVLHALSTALAERSQLADVADMRHVVADALTDED
jgi:RpiR family transcriptional regulator, carbohydrate utilization regulator